MKDILEDVPEFASKIIKELNRLGIDPEPFEMDHVCYRVACESEYQMVKDYLLSLASLLIEQPVGGRLISTFKLHEPIRTGDRLIDVIELPMPKKSSPYPTGWEHAEFAIGSHTDLKEFASRYPLNWDYAGISKEFNSDIRLGLFDGTCSVKFHHLPLEQVIAIELGNLRVD